MKRVASSHGPGRYFLSLRLARLGYYALLRHISVLSQALRQTLARQPCQIAAIAVLAEVIHTIWSLPPRDPANPNRADIDKDRV